MKKVRKDLTELTEEEQIIGWYVGISYQRGATDRYESIRVDTKERAEKVANEVAETGYFKPENDEKLVIMPHVEDIVSVILTPITRTIYVN